MKKFEFNYKVILRFSLLLRKLIFLLQSQLIFHEANQRVQVHRPVYRQPSEWVNHLPKKVHSPYTINQILTNCKLSKIIRAI